MTQATSSGLTTRERVLQLIITDGPITANDLADRLKLTAAGIRRHLSALVNELHITSYEHAEKAVGPGRPAQYFVATSQGQSTLTKGYENIAVAALRYLKESGGEGAVEEFAEEQMAVLRAEIEPALKAAGDDMEERARVLAEELSRRGYAATIRSVAGAPILQLCQGNCPVQDVAAQFPQICEAETRTIAQTLGVHVQRLATIASGEHVCTTSIPIPEAVRGMRATSQDTAASSGRPEGN